MIDKRKDRDDSKPLHLHLDMGRDEDDDKRKDRDDFIPLHLHLDMG